MTVQETSTDFNHNSDLEKTNRKSISDAIVRFWKKSAISSQNWHNRPNNTVAYDTAWVSDIVSKDSTKPLIPQTLDWLKINQNADGSWGSSYPVYFDRLLSTIKTVSALSKYHGSERQVKSGLEWLSVNLPQAPQELTKEQAITGIGTGIILPPLVKELELRTGIDFHAESLLSKWDRKIHKLDLSAVINTATHVSWSLEFLEGLKFLGKEDMVSQLYPERQLVGNGSIICSNAATAWYAQQEHLPYRQMSLKYLMHSLNTDGGVPQFTPMDGFNLLWSAYPLVSVLDTVPTHYMQGLMELKARLQPAGIGMGRYFPFPDADDTAVLLHLLNKTNLIEDNNQFFQFYQHYDMDSRWYETYIGRYGSTSSRSLSSSSNSGNNDRFTASTNLHIFELFYESTNNAFRDEVLDKLDTSFSNYFASNPYFSHDRWHSSPAYNNFHGVMAFALSRPDWADQCMTYFLESQNQNTGLWGNITQGTAMETTSYAVLAITHYHNYIQHVDLDILSQAVNYLSGWDYTTMDHQAAMLLCKTLYACDFQADLPLAALLSYKKALTT